MEVRGVPLAELRRRFLSDGECVNVAVLRELRMDPRCGARALARALKSRLARSRAEARRLRRLFAFEEKLHAHGRRRIAGVDEVGVGPLAGPVVAASVVLPRGTRLPGLDDSKRVRASMRERLDREIREIAVDLSIGIADLEEIDRLNIYHAALLAMRRAVNGLREPPGLLLVDARTIPELVIPQRAIIGGDADVASIAAASIVAKVYRDGRMRELDRQYPGYGFASNAGYGTQTHLRALRERGPCPIHRSSFGPVREALQALGPA